MLADQFAQPRRILDVYGLHARNVGATQLVRLQKFLADTQVLVAHGEKFAAEGLVQHEGDYAGGRVDGNPYF